MLCENITTKQNKKQQKIMKTCHMVLSIDMDR